MQVGKLRVQVVQVPAGPSSGRGEGPRSDGSWPRDLLPWADPYVMALMQKLQKRYGECETELTDDITLYQFAAQVWLGEEWQDETVDLTSDQAEQHLSESDDELASPDESFEKYPPVIGGFPLLEDWGDEDFLAL